MVMNDYKTHYYGHKNRLLLLAVSISYFCSWSDVLAQSDTGSLSEHYFFDEVPVVLSATRLSQPLSDIPAAVTIIDKQMIRASGAMEIPDLLRLVPGFHVARYHGAKFSASYHGNSDDLARDMQVLVDGRSVYDPGFGGVSWSDLPVAIEDINRIEVVRGPNAAAYGSNSFAGVVNIITEHPAEQQGTMLKLIAGTEDTSQVVLRHAGSHGALDYRLTLNYDENEGLEKLHDGSTTGWFSYRGDYQIDGRDRMLFETGYSSGKREDGFPNDDVQPLRDTYHAYNFQQIKWIRTIAPENELSLQFYHNYQEIDDETDFFDARLPGVPLNMGFGFETHRYDFELQHNFSPNDVLRLVWGLGARHDRMHSWNLLDSHDHITRDQLRAFINAEWRALDKLNINIGAMYENFEGYKDLFSPRLAFNYHLTNNHTVRYSASRAYRMPTIWEAYADLQVHGIPAPWVEHIKIATPGMDPERIDALEIGYFGIFPESNITLDLRLFREKIDPLISHRRDESIFPSPPDIEDGAMRFFNSGYLEMEGVEVQIDYRPTERTIFHLGYSEIKTKGEEVRDILASGIAQLPPRDLEDMVAKHVLGFLAGHEFRNGLQISVSGYNIDRVEWKGEGNYIPGYERYDLRLAKKLKLPSADAEVSLVLQNIDGRYTEFREESENETDARAYLQFSLKFN
jgi:iron complex outermembrane receptor protein